MGPLRNKRILENPIVGPTAIVDSQLVFFDVCNASGHEYSVCPPQLDILLSKVLFICMSRRLMKVDIISKPKFLSHRSSVIISCVNVDIAAHQNTILCSILVHITMHYLRKISEFLANDHGHKLQKQISCSIKLLDFQANLQSDPVSGLARIHDPSFHSFDSCPGYRAAQRLPICPQVHSTPYVCNFFDNV